MGTSAFDKLWDAPKLPQKNTGFDALWGEDKPDPNAALHAEFKSGALQRRIQAENEVEQAGVQSPPPIRAPQVRVFGSRALSNEENKAPWESFSTAVRTGLGSIGAGKLLAAGRAHDYGISQADAERATGQEIKQFEGDYPRTALATKIVPNILALNSLPGKLLQSGRFGGAAISAGSAAVNRLGSVEHPDESIVSKMKGAAGDAIIGGGVGYAAPWLAARGVFPGVVRAGLGAAGGAWLAPKGYETEGAAAGGLAAASPSNTARLVSQVAEKVGAAGGQMFAKALDALSQATGTRGAVNTEMKGVQDILLPLGTKVGESGGVAGVKLAEAEQFNAQASKLYEKMRAAVTNDPRMQKYLLDPDFQEVFTAVLRERGLPKGTNPLDPDILHTVKQVVRNVMQRKYLVDQPLSRETAARLAPKLEAFTTDLHTAYPEARVADNYFQVGRTAQDAYEMAAGAARPSMRNPTPANLGINDVAGVNEFVNNLQHSDPTIQAQMRIVARRAAEAGGKGQIAQQVAAKGLEGGRSGVLSVPALAVSGPAAEQRALAMGSATQDFNKTLTNVRLASQADNAKPGVFANTVTALSRGKISPSSGTESALSSRAGIQMLDDITANPAQYQDVLKQFNRGKGMLDALQNFLALQGGSAIGRSP